MTHGAPAPYLQPVYGVEYVPTHYVYQNLREFKFGSSTLRLPALKVNDDTIIYVLNIMGGDARTIKKYASELIDGFNTKFGIDADGFVSAEGKSIPLVYEIAYQEDKSYVIFRKSCKPYMGAKVLSAKIKTITTGDEELYLDNKDLVNISNKKLVFIDDVISSGATLKACEKIVSMAGGRIVGCISMAIEGDYMPTLPTYSLGILPIIKLVKNA
jgi:adenine phosphoribosyltransferase